MALILGIETTCDETAVAVVKNGKEIFSSIVASQTDLHKLYGGVIPELACRRHIDALIPALEEALKSAKVSLEEIDAIAVAKGPGLIGALLIGLNAAKSLSFALNKPLIGVNHVEAHLYSCMMTQEISFPALGVIVSGGHTMLLSIPRIGTYELIGETTDDAVGEAFDKVAVLLGLSYPGGPLIELLAREGDPERFPFKAGQVKGRPFDFSFSGLKTNVMYTLKGQGAKKQDVCVIHDDDKKHVAASFQKAALENIVFKALQAASYCGSASIVVGGGVSNNKVLQKLFLQHASIPVFFPEAHLTSDNAAMIAGLAFHYLHAPDDLTLEPQTRIVF